MWNDLHPHLRLVAFIRCAVHHTHHHHNVPPLIRLDQFTARIRAAQRVRRSRNVIKLCGHRCHLHARCFRRPRSVGRQWLRRRCRHGYVRQSRGCCHTRGSGCRHLWDGRLYACVTGRAWGYCDRDWRGSRAAAVIRVKHDNHDDDKRREQQDVAPCRVRRLGWAFHRVSFMLWCCADCTRQSVPPFHIACINLFRPPSKVRGSPSRLRPTRNRQTDGRAVGRFQGLMSVLKTDITDRHKRWK